MVLAKDRCTDQWEKRGSPEIGICINSQLTLDERNKNIKWGKVHSLTNGIIHIASEHGLWNQSAS